MSKPRITIRFDEEVYELVQTQAEEQDRSINWVVNNLLQQALKNNSDEISLIDPSN
ncbi:ribbon-helix-helix domain-containing protein [Vibrio genomosp. F10 str. 9ZC157]|uniref:ribbon-helix-helix domain-containing protein n=1 Tax=Vibrio genomosp. F10 TaxID=723171 RepID=UPI00031E8343|nr:Arc family DNA-binding protein [Vibrio genomosp. F10]